MNRITLSIICAIVLLSLAGMGSASDVRSELASKDRNLSAVIQKHVQSPEYRAARVKPTALCASDGKALSCTAAGEAVIKRASVINVDGRQVRNTLPIGNIAAKDPICICYLDPNTPSGWRCTPKGCWGDAGPDFNPGNKLEQTTIPRTIPQQGARPPRP